MTLTDPALPTAAYSTLLDPEHVLDVRDLAGNAFRRKEVFLGQLGTVP